MTDLKVPTGIEQVTADWLRSALNRPDTAQPLNVEQIGQEYGFASQLYRVKLADVTIVIKLWDTNKFGDKEILFYRHFQDCGCKIPHCFFSGIDPQTKRGVLILENVPVSAQGDVLNPLTPKQAQNLTLNLARLHAKWAGNSALKTQFWLDDFSRWAPSAEWLKSRRTVFLKRFGSQLSSESLKLINHIEQVPVLVHSRLGKMQHTLLHGDFHLDNIVFEGDETPIILDWARPGVGPATHNLSSLLFEMAPLSQFNDLLGLYLSEFNTSTTQPISKDEMSRALGGSILRLFVQQTCGVAMWHPSSDRGDQIIETGIKKANQMIKFWLARDPDLFSFY